MQVANLTADLAAVNTAVHAVRIIVTVFIVPIINLPSILMIYKQLLTLTRLSPAQH
jgi:hypothetical protein